MSYKMNAKEKAKHYLGIEEEQYLSPSERRQLQAKTQKIKTSRKKARRRKAKEIEKQTICLMN